MFGAAAAVLVLGAGVLFLTERPLTVSVVQPEQDVALRIYGLGSVEARILSRVGFEVGATLTGLAADVGNRVVRGQELATIDPAEQEARTARARAAVEANVAALARAEATVARARSVLAQRQAANQRQQGLAQRDVTSIQRAEEAQRDEDVARADLAVAEADVAVIRAQRADAAAALEQEKVLLARHRLSAPYDAVIVTRHAEAGTVVRAGDPIFTLIAPETVWIQAYVDEERAGQLALGQPGTIRLRSQPQAEFQGIIARIGLESDRVNEERRIWLTCTDCPQPMYLGEQAEVRITTGNRNSALMVPEVAITGFEGHRGRVWLVRDGRLEQVELTFGARDDRGRVEVTGSLPDDAAIVAQIPQGATEGRRARTRTTP
ncbi:efflux RND transporter periplasmic adaptor subunit [Pseudochrobactrum algeriensis]|uniref:efflux RND transporter periplasmic adaptor subunit n=1 Tax=Pseudochrobactrum TaxID=354349 RepID=UPI001BCEEAD5|nr:MULTISPECIES: efflux RND transporter periplasmic adaptor subunit [Pseudochrobactrum]MDM8347232.1 efflux RND transporter periplasmic adaptor subunit [Pseudochrobactrum sp. sp1633]QVQ36637.1 efflux RND transporter periplasmic adaptor subunit [Pseudochrobactrum algeriensis]QVQ39852.1 efflux RND transporter periplasmic adaptor subunit [Pseudochrobactrum algeriensis]QVQ43774.1 efflux RND transporter periplasmic adaptor subunit [Pseudochrobactrum algeriensis]